MLKKYFTPEIFFCIAIFIGMPVCVSYALLDKFVTPRVILVSVFVLVFVAVIFRKEENASLLKSIPFISLCIFLLLFAFSITKSLNPGESPRPPGIFPGDRDFTFLCVCLSMVEACV